MISIHKMLYNAEKPGSIILACFKILLFQNISLFVSVEWKYRTAEKEVWEYEARQESNWSLSSITDYLTGRHRRTVYYITQYSIIYSEQYFAPQ